MPPPLPLANLFTYFSQSNVAGQVIVVLLVFFSFAAWTLMIGKYLDLKRMRLANRLFEDRLEATPVAIRVDPRLSLGDGPVRGAVARRADGLPSQRGESARHRACGERAATGGGPGDADV
jgi:biopolymer transport protein ExbB/TolQ